LIAWMPLRADGPRARARRAVVSRDMNRLVVAVAIVIAGAALAGCGSRERTALRIGINAEPGYEFAYLAQARGLFEREHVSVQLVEFESMSDSRRAYERGQLDGFFGTVFEALQARTAGDREPRIVRVLDCSQGYDVLLARPGIPDVTNLCGTRVAVEPGSLNIYLLARALEDHGLSLDSLRMMNMDSGEMREALRSGRVDATVSYPPASNVIVAAGLAKPIFSSAEIPGEVIDVLVIDGVALTRRAGEVAGFLRAYDGAVAWTTGNRAQAIGIMAAREHVSPGEFEESLDHGLELVSASQQEAYFSAGGMLSRVVDETSRLLVHTGQLRATVRAEDVLATERTR
jgi:NitT/TauT family transport system substrate-binding protein